MAGYRYSGNDYSGSFDTDELIDVEKVLDEQQQTLLDELPICGVTRVTGGTEWICVNPVHDNGGSDRNTSHPMYPPRADRHHFVNRWPNRERS